MTELDACMCAVVCDKLVCCMISKTVCCSVSCMIGKTLGL